MACPAGRVVIHNFARRAILDALAPADRLIDVGCGDGLLLEFFGADRERTRRVRSVSSTPAPAANRPGLRHVAFTVDDVRGVVDRVQEAGWEIVDFENTFLLCYVRGPEGLIVELAERLDGAPD
jgi:catechol 2,3-dioxygenase-like lactoylglutathione lyase family enzyme